MLNIKENVSLAQFTTFSIGGTAKYFVYAASGQEIIEALQYAKDNKLPVFVLGGGSNILFSDEGFNGLVIKIDDKHITIHDTIISAGAGAVLMDVILSAQEAGLTGMELMAGIPGTVGGAIRGNAGAFGVEIGELVETVSVLNTDTLKLNSVTKKECNFSYRQSVFKKSGHLLIVETGIRLQKGDSTKIASIIHETVATRESKHPQHLACAGSFFMNPEVKNQKLLQEFAHETGTPSKNGKLPAGWLIDYVGLRGKKVGGAQVSEIHPNYILNTGNATAEDVLILASLVKQRVRTQLGIRLREEVQMVGFE